MRSIETESNAHMRCAVLRAGAHAWQSQQDAMRIAVALLTSCRQVQQRAVRACKLRQPSCTQKLQQAGGHTATDRCTDRVGRQGLLTLLLSDAADGWQQYVGLLKLQLVMCLRGPQPSSQSEGLRLTCAVKYSSDGVPFGCTLDCGTYVTRDLHCGTPRCCGVSSSSVRVPACRAMIVMQQCLCACQVRAGTVAVRNCERKLCPAVRWD